MVAGASSKLGYHSTVRREGAHLAARPAAGSSRANHGLERQDHRWGDRIVARRPARGPARAVRGPSVGPRQRHTRTTRRRWGGAGAGTVLPRDLPRHGPHRQGGWPRIGTGDRRPPRPEGGATPEFRTGTPGDRLLHGGQAAGLLSRGHAAGAAAAAASLSAAGAVLHGDPAAGLAGRQRPRGHAARAPPAGGASAGVDERRFRAPRGADALAP